MTESKVQPPAGIKQQPSVPEEIAMGTGPDSKQAIILYHVDEILSRDPDKMVPSIQELEKKGLITTPEALAACVATGYGLENIARQDLRTGAIAFYAAYISGSAARIWETAGELCAFVQNLPEEVSLQEQELLRHLIHRLQKTLPLVQSTIAINNLSDAAAALPLPLVATSQHENELIESFEKTARKLDAVVAAQNDAGAAVRAHFLADSPSLDNYLVGILATNLPPSRGALQEGLALLEQINPTLSNMLRDAGGHIQWRKG